MDTSAGGRSPRAGPAVGTGNRANPEIQCPVGIGKPSSAALGGALHYYSHACRSQRPLCPVPLFSVAVADITKNQPHSLWRASALQVAACGLCSPATGGTGAAASCGVARAASRDDRERPTVPLGTAQSRRTVPLSCFSAGLRVLAAMGEFTVRLRAETAIRSARRREVH